ncbi:hypothetical protein PSAC2689_20262 [Paraburkholderia sacchari]
MHKTHRVTKWHPKLSELSYPNSASAGVGRH